MQLRTERSELWLHVCRFLLNRDGVKSRKGVLQTNVKDFYLETAEAAEGKVSPMGRKPPKAQGLETDAPFF